MNGELILGWLLCTGPASSSVSVPQLGVAWTQAAEGQTATTRNALINPGVSENCKNGIDDNYDGLTDDADPACETPGWGAASAAEASTVRGNRLRGSEIGNHLGMIPLPLGVLLAPRIAQRRRK